MKIVINVTEKDIDKAGKLHEMFASTTETFCPIAQALKRHGENVKAGYDFLEITKKGKKYLATPSDEMEGFMEYFDDREYDELYPVKFEVEFEEVK